MTKKQVFAPINYRGEALTPQLAECVVVLGLELVLHKTPDPQTGEPTSKRLYSVSDPISGCKIVQNKATKFDATHGAEERIAENGGVEGFLKARERQLEKYKQAAACA